MEHKKPPRRHTGSRSIFRDDLRRNSRCTYRCAVNFFFVSRKHRSEQKYEKLKTGTLQACFSLKRRRFSV